MPKPTSYQELDFQDLLARREQLAKLLTMERVVERIRGRLGDTTYRLAGGRFDWERFARESFPEVQPPLESWELLDQLQRTRPAGRPPFPRRLLWWAVRVYTGAEDPDAWLQAERQREAAAGSAQPIARIAERLRAAAGADGLELQAKDLYHYLARLRQGDREERAAAVAQQLSWEVIQARLWAALRARRYRRRGAPRQLDWRRFARESFPEVKPPLDGKELVQLIGQTMPGYNGGVLPRQVVWWAVRVGVGAEDPNAWLRAARQQAGPADSVRQERLLVAELAGRIAAQLEGAVSSEEIAAYIGALRPTSADGAAETEV